MSSISAASESLGNSEDDQDVLDYSPRAAGHNSQPLEEVLSGIGEILQDDDEILDQIKLIEKKSSSITANSEELDADELRVFPEKARSSKKKRFGLSEVKARSRSFDESVSLLMRNNRIILRNLRLFETNETLLLVGSNSSGKFFRVLKFDRQSGIELRLEEEENVFDAKQMRKYLSNLNEIYKSKGGVRHIMNAEAFLGVVTIWNHNYLLFVTKKELVGTIYSKHIFQVKDSALIPITNPNEKKKVSSEETKYRAFFQSVDLSEDFYFSFTYDLTNTLQSNMVEADEKGNNLYQEKFLWNYYPASVFLRSHHNGSHWMVPLIQGFFEQRNVQVGSKILTITLLARRSRHHAGTRYNKRGINLYGHVANEVESEQMISSEKSWVEGRGQISSFVSLRGSIPLFWRQSNPLAPKPDITIYKSEKDLASTKLHFEQLFKRYGTPIVCINLIKQTEKKPQEIIVGEEFQNCIGSLSVEFSSKFNYCALNYITYDFLSQLKSKVDVTADLFRLASGIVESFRWFYHDTVPEKFFHSLKPENVKKLQSGTVRINCIDCLDRTNVAQFCVGLAAMGNQLLELGIIESLLNWETRNFDLMKLLQKLYISQGDRIAHQYGGSGTMHKASLSKKGSSDSSGKVGNALTAIKRYYSNNFLDFDKQHAINVFLGCFIPSPDKAHIWDLEPEKPMYDVDFLYPTGDMKFSIPYGVKENLGSAFDFFFEEKYTPSSLTFFEEKLKCSYIKQVDITSLSRMSSFAELNKKFREKIARNMEFDFTIPSLTGSNLSYSSGKAVVHAGNDIIEEDIIPSDEIDTNDSTNARMETTDGYKDETLKLNTVNDGYTVQESNIENLSHNFQLESESIIQLKDSTSEYEDYVNIERVLHSGPQKSSLFKRAESDENAANLIKVMFNEIMSFRNNMDSRLREIEKAVKDSKFN